MDMCLTVEMNRCRLTRTVSTVKKLVKADLTRQVEDIPQLDRTAEGGALWPREHFSLNSAAAWRRRIWGAWWCLTKKMRGLSHWYHFRPQSTYRLEMKYGECILRVHTEWRLPIFDLHPIMMEKSALAGEGGGDVRPPPFSLLSSHTTGRYTHPIYPSILLKCTVSATQLEHTLQLCMWWWIEWKRCGAPPFISKGRFFHHWWNVCQKSAIATLFVLRVSHPKETELYLGRYCARLTEQPVFVVYFPGIIRAVTANA
jgi:hypothetical protein